MAAQDQLRSYPCICDHLNRKFSETEKRSELQIDELTRELRSLAAIKVCLHDMYFAVHVDD